MQRTLDPPSLVTAPDRFPDSLPVWQDPSRTSGGLGHLVTADAPSGIAHGLVLPTPIVQRAAGSVPEPARPWWWPAPSPRRAPGTLVQRVPETPPAELPVTAIQPDTAAAAPVPVLGTLAVPAAPAVPAARAVQRAGEPRGASDEQRWRLPAVPDPPPEAAPLVRAPLPPIPPLRLAALPLQRHGVEAESAEADAFGQSDEPAAPNRSGERADGGERAGHAESAGTPASTTVPLIAQRMEAPHAGRAASDDQQASPSAHSSRSAPAIASEPGVTAARSVQRSVAPPAAPAARPRRLGLGPPVQRSWHAGTAPSSGSQPARVEPTGREASRQAGPQDRMTDAATATVRPIGSRQVEVQSGIGTPAIVQRSTDAPAAAPATAPRLASGVPSAHATSAPAPAQEMPVSAMPVSAMPAAIAPLVGGPTSSIGVLGSDTDLPLQREMRDGAGHGRALPAATTGSPLHESLPAVSVEPAPVQRMGPVQRMDPAQRMEAAQAGSAEPSSPVGDLAQLRVAGLVGERPIERWLGDSAAHSNADIGGSTAPGGAGHGINGARRAPLPAGQPSVQRSVGSRGGQGAVAATSHPTLQRLPVTATPRPHVVPAFGAASGDRAPAAPPMLLMARVPDMAPAPDMPPVSPQAVEVSVQRDAADEAQPSPVGPAAGAGAAPPGSPPAAAAAGSTSPTEVDALVRRLYDPLMRRLKAELRLDRERAGHVLDLRH